MKNNQNINVWSYLEEYNEYEKDLEKIVNEVFKSGRLILGEKVSEFENNFSNWVGTKYGTGVGNGTDAIKLALLSKGVVRFDNSFKIGDGLSIVFNKKIVAKGIAKIDSSAVGESSVLIHKDDLIIL